MDVIPDNLDKSPTKANKKKCSYEPRS